MPQRCPNSRELARNRVRFRPWPWKRDNDLDAERRLLALDLIELTDSGTAEIVPAALVPRDQVWFAHPEMQARMREAHEDIAADRTTRVTKRSELRAHLNRLKRESRSG